MRHEHTHAIYDKIGLEMCLEPRCNKIKEMGYDTNNMAVYLSNGKQSISVTSNRFDSLIIRLKGFIYEHLQSK